MTLLEAAPVLTQIAKSFSDAVSAAITLVVGAAAVALAGWIKSKFSAPVQRQAVLEAALEIEREVADNPDDNPTGPEKKERAIRRARKKLPFMHTAILPLGPKVEEVMPQVWRMSSPPPEPPA
jgi:hypothetical protein